MPLSKISRYRTEIMGVSILWIMFFHSKIHIPGILIPIKFIQNIGYGGVDIFFFLSGFGLYHGWFSKKQSCITFMKRRFLRTLPPYWIVVILYSILDNLAGNRIGWVDLLYKMSFLSFIFQNDKLLWFIPAILFCYAIFPLIVMLIRFGDGTHQTSRNTILLIGFSLFVSLLMMHSGFNKLLMLSTRIPVFILGIYSGHVHINRLKLFYFENRTFNIISMLTGIILLAIILKTTTEAVRSHYGLWWFPFILITYPFCRSSALIIERLYKPIDHVLYRGLRKLLNFFGRYSLEMYLVHVSIFTLLPKIIEHFSPLLLSHKINVCAVPEYGMYALLSAVFSYMLGSLLNQLVLKKRFVLRGHS